MQVDRLAMRLTREPETFDVLLLTNLYGDIPSDLCAGLGGGLGPAAGANIGWEYAVFEPVHGSGPDIAGRGAANPVAMVLSGAMLLRHLGEHSAADAVEAAVDHVLEAGDVRTPGRILDDRGGGAGPRPDLVTPGQWLMPCAPGAGRASGSPAACGRKGVEGAATEVRDERQGR